MISESRYWKQLLLRAATWLEKISVDELDENLSARIEREVFVGFYSIRKLLATFKVSDTTKKASIKLNCYPVVNAEPIDYFNKNNIDELFDLKVVSSEARDLEFLCNQFIHSYIFLITTQQDGRIEGFFVSSDKSSSKKLYFVTVQQVVNSFRLVGKDYPKNLHLKRNETTSQWEEII